MSPVRMFSSLCCVLVTAFAASALTGCYDLSDPSGPHQDDFMPTQAAATEGDPAAERAETPLTENQGRAVEADAGHVDRPTFTRLEIRQDDSDKP
jgi:hypothetical protein